MRYQKWMDKNLEDLSGKIAIVTGANSGIGYYTTLGLAFKGCKVIMACRSLEKANKAKDEILKQINNADLEVIKLDVSSFKSIEEFKETIIKKYQSIDILVNNAGLYTSQEKTTMDGFEMVMGTNYLGTYALTCTLFSLLKNSEQGRIVNVSSIVHRKAKIDYNDFFGLTSNKKEYYRKSKLAVLTFSEYLGNYCTENKINIKVCGAHPGVSKTNIFKVKSGSLKILINMMASAFLKTFTHHAFKASLSILYAAANKNVEQNDYYGPRGIYEISGYPKKCFKSKEVYNNHDKLINISVEATKYTLS